jgi:hypothetical protein
VTTLDFGTAWTSFSNLVMALGTAGFLLLASLLLLTVVLRQLPARDMLPAVVLLGALGVWFGAAAREDLRHFRKVTVAHDGSVQMFNAVGFSLGTLAPGEPVSIRHVQGTRGGVAGGIRKHVLRWTEIEGASGHVWRSVSRPPGYNAENEAQLDARVAGLP